MINFKYVHFYTMKNVTNKKQISTKNIHKTTQIYQLKAAYYKDMEKKKLRLLKNQ